MEWYAGSGIMALVPMERTVSVGMCAGCVPRQESWASGIRAQHMTAQVPGPGLRSARSRYNFSGLSSLGWGNSWSTEGFIKAHKLVRESGRHNFEGCRIPIPTNIRYDRIKDALGDNATPKEERMLCLLEFGMPIDCKPGYGVKKSQRNHFSALSFKEEVNEYFKKGVQAQAILGPFKLSPIPDLCYSPLMSVPKESSK